jgi:beta-glucosidase-like glycosyl hydrolase
MPKYVNLPKLKELAARDIEVWDRFKRGQNMNKIAVSMNIDYKQIQKIIFNVSGVLSGEVLARNALQSLTYLTDRHNDRVVRLWNNYAMLEAQYSEPDPSKTKLSLFSKVKLQTEIIDQLRQEDEELRKNLVHMGILTKENPNTVIVAGGDVNVQNNVFNDWIDDFTIRLKKIKDKQAEVKEVE